MPAANSALVISICSFGPIVPCPPVMNILMISAPSLISARTERRNSSGPSLGRMAPSAPISQCGGKLRSPACPVVLTSRLQGTSRGPGISPRSMATFIEASMAKGAPAETAPVNPLLTRRAKLLTARTACRAIGSSSPNGAGVAPRLW